ncbi:MAG: 50S ribosomal protein L29 [Alphaproteobacteria bacterium]|nr:50S ribosomal protein L29 [Alphaproteobacteria bacterium]
MGLTKASDIRTKSDDELKEQLGVLRKEQFNLRFQKSTGQLAKPARSGHVKKEIAKVLTIQNQRCAEKGAQKNKAKG